MTSQVAIFNLECVAVASDSVATIEDGTNQRTVSSSEKVLAFGPEHRVVAMTNGEARFMMIPWAVLIAEWQRTLSGPLPSLQDYGKSLVRWLPTRRDLFDPDSQNKFFDWQVRDWYLFVRSNLIQAMEEQGLADEDWGAQAVITAVDAVVDDALEMLGTKPDLVGPNPDHDAPYLRASEDRIREQFDFVFDDVPRSVRSDERLLREAPALILAKDEGWGFDSTMAFIGYGAADVFPGHQVLEFHGLVNDTVRVVWEDPECVSTSNTSIIQPFAQAEAINTFLRAYNYDFLKQAHESLEQVFADQHSNAGFDADVSALLSKLHETLEDDFERLSWSKFVDPMLATIAALPKVEMARMAEALVGLQALRSASMSSMPTVGGPIDVVVISRSSGVEWLRRKRLELD